MFNLRVSAMEPLRRTKILEIAAAGFARNPTVQEVRFAVPSDLGVTLIAADGRSSLLMTTPPQS